MHAIAEAALIADAPSYVVLRPALLQLKQKQTPKEPDVE
jgi:hypothetical protein